MVKHLTIEFIFACIFRFDLYIMDIFPLLDPIKIIKKFR